jgi:hypothetical protein
MPSRVDIVPEASGAQWHTTIFRLYARVLRLLGPQIRLGWVLALANVALAAAQFAEPVLFGRIIDSLAGAQGAEGSLSWARLSPLVAAWVAARLSRFTPTGLPTGVGRRCFPNFSNIPSGFR